MKLYRFIFLFCAAILGSTAMAQSQRELQQLMRDRGEYYFTLNVDDFSQIQTINELCSVDAVKGNTIICYANQKQYERLLEAGYNPQLQTPPCFLEETALARLT